MANSRSTQVKVTDFYWKSISSPVGSVASTTSLVAAVVTRVPHLPQRFTVVTETRRKIENETVSSSNERIVKDNIYCINKIT